MYEAAPSDLAKEIYAREGSVYGIEAKHRYVDTRYALGAGSRNMSTNTTIGMVEMMAKAENGGILLELPNVKHIDAQREIIKADMLYNTHAPVSQFNEPTLFIDPSCKNLITTLKNHRLVEDPSGGSKEVESEKYKDASDALRIAYAGIFNNFSYSKPGEKKVNLLYPGLGRNSGGWMK
jgi:hypothetical protein